MVENMSTETAPNWLEYIMAAFQAGFWVTLSTIAILSFLQAKKTIFQPIKTELFKVQIEEFKNILEIFSGKGEIQLCNEYGQNKALIANIKAMLDCYAEINFSVKISENDRYYAGPDFPTNLVNPEALKYWTLIDDIKERKYNRIVGNYPWSEYVHECTYLPKEFSEYNQRLFEISNNPALPEELVNHIKLYMQTINMNMVAIFELMDETYKSLEEHYPTLKDLNEYSSHWIQNIYIRKYTKVEPLAKNIVHFIRSYLKPDEIYK